MCEIGLNIPCDPVLEPIRSRRRSTISDDELGAETIILNSHVSVSPSVDMSFASALTYDFEVFSGAQERWLEVSSVSNFESFQTNRMKVRFKGADGKTQLVHSLNGSSLALPRIMACLLENNQTTTGIKIPEVLQKYFGKAQID